TSGWNRIFGPPRRLIRRCGCVTNGRFTKCETGFARPALRCATTTRWERPRGFSWTIRGATGSRCWLTEKRDRARVHRLLGVAYCTQSALALSASQLLTSVPNVVSWVSAMLLNIGGPQELSVTQAVQLAPLESTRV